MHLSNEETLFMRSNVKEVNDWALIIVTFLPKYLFVGIHAREWIAVSTGLFLINNLVELFRQEMVSNTHDSRAQVKYYILPLLNPDGYEFSHTGMLGLINLVHLYKK